MLVEPTVCCLGSLKLALLYPMGNLRFCWLFRFDRIINHRRAQLASVEGSPCTSLLGCEAHAFLYPKTHLISSKSCWYPRLLLFCQYWGWDWCYLKQVPTDWSLMWKIPEVAPNIWLFPWSRYPLFWINLPWRAKARTLWPCYCEFWGQPKRLEY